MTDLPVSVIFLSWQSVDETLAAVKSAHSQLQPQDEIVVVDNGSEDAITDELRARLNELRDVRLLELPDNLGYGAGMNRGSEVAIGTWLVFSNNDLELPESFLRSLRGAFLEPECNQLLSPHVVDGDGNPSLGFGYRPSLRRLIGTALGLHWVRPRRFALVAQSFEDSDWIQGVCLAMSRETFNRVGGFSETTFMYCEDLRLCMSIRRIGGPIQLIDDAVTHIDDFSADLRWPSAAKEAVKSYEFARASAELDPRRRQRTIAAIHLVTCIRGFAFRRSPASRGRVVGAWRYLLSSMRREQDEPGSPTFDPGHQ